MNLLVSFRSEIIKSKRTSAVYLTLVTAAIIPVIFLLDVAFDGISPANRKSPFNAMFREGFKMTGFVIFPMFIILISTLLPQIETKNNAWKQVLASPQTKLNLFIAKYLYIQLLSIVFLVANNIFMLFAAVAINFIDPTLHLIHQPLNVHDILVNNLNTWITLLAVGAMQFWAGLRFKNFIFPVALGFVLWFIGAMIVIDLHWAFARFFPYSFQIYGIWHEYKPGLPAVQITSVVYTAAFLILGFIDFKRKGTR